MLLDENISKKQMERLFMQKVYNFRYKIKILKFYGVKSKYSQTTRVCFVLYPKTKMFDKMYLFCSPTFLNGISTW